jgi:hypothetical protein
VAWKLVSSVILKKRPWNVAMKNEVLWVYLRSFIRDKVWSRELMYLLKGSVTTFLNSHYKLPVFYFQSYFS